MQSSYTSSLRAEVARSNDLNPSCFKLSMNFSCTNIECIYIGNAVGGAILACVANYWCPIVNSSKAFSVIGASGYVQHPENSPKPEFWNGAVKQTLLLANMPCGDMWNYVG